MSIVVFWSPLCVRSKKEKAKSDYSGKSCVKLFFLSVPMDYRIRLLVKIDFMVKKETITSKVSP